MAHRGPKYSRVYAGAACATQYAESHRRQVDRLVPRHCQLHRLHGSQDGYGRYGCGWLLLTIKSTKLWFVKENQKGNARKRRGTKKERIKCHIN